MEVHVLMADGESKVFHIFRDHAVVEGKRITLEEARALWKALKKEGWMVP